MKIYDLVKELLTEYPPLRDSDKKLIWMVWYRLGLARKTSISGLLEEKWMISREAFYDAPSSESITRARRKVQENEPKLGPTEKVQEFRDDKEAMKGNHVYHESV